MLDSWIEKFARRIPAAMYRFFIRRPAIGFFYHLISPVPATSIDQPDHHKNLPKRERDLIFTKERCEEIAIDHLYDYKTYEMFERDLIYLKEKCCPISYQQLSDYYLNGTELEPNAVHISFDDGLAECFSVARPLLLKHGIPCTFFITTDLIDNQTMFYRHKVSSCIEKFRKADDTWRKTAYRKFRNELGVEITNSDQFERWAKSLESSDQTAIRSLCEISEFDADDFLQECSPYLTQEQIRVLAADGFTIGAHSQTHPMLGQLKPDQVCQEIIGSCQVIAEITGNGPVPFAFPYQSLGIDRQLLKNIYQKNDFVGLFFDTNGILPYEDFIVDRIWADAPEWNLGRSTLPDLLHLTYQNMLLEKMRKLGVYQ